jgi:hypothetical protein
MANRTNHNIAREIVKLNEIDTSIHAYQPNASSKNQLRDSFLNDDLIASLSNAYENRRARQVVEWERLYRQNVHV